MADYGPGMLTVDQVAKRLGISHTSSRRLVDLGKIPWAANSADLYVLLVDERGWTPARYQAWLADTWARILLPSS